MIEKKKINLTSRLSVKWSFILSHHLLSESVSWKKAAPLSNCSMARGTVYPIPASINHRMPILATQDMKSGALSILFPMAGVFVLYNTRIRLRLL
jgi:hypothetical protein